MPRIYCPDPLLTHTALGLPREASRHIQVLRMQPGMAVTLFDGRGGEFEATITAMGRQAVDVLVGTHQPREREAAHAVHLAVCMPANERMDWLVEKATELGVQRITPLVAQRNVVRLQGERAQKKQAHWRAVAIAACEQCGRNQVPVVDAPVTLAQWLRDQALPTTGDVDAHRVVLSLTDTQTDGSVTPASGATRALIGPEGGLTPEEEASAQQQGFARVQLGPRVLRTETAALAALMHFGHLG